jgi:FtsZ-interacting cell division protein ZipA
MRRDVMENAGLEIFAEIGLIIFVIVFIAILLTAIFMRREKVEYLSNLPLSEGTERSEEEVNA